MSVQNAIKLLNTSEVEHPDHKREPDAAADFMENYTDDKMAATFQVLKLQRDFLYQTFHDTRKVTGGSPKPLQKRKSTNNDDTPRAKRQGIARLDAPTCHHHT